MNLLNFKIIFLLFGVISLAYGAIQYKGWKIYKVVPKSRAEADFLHNLSAQNDNDIDMLTLSKLPNEMASAMISPEYQEKFEKQLLSNGMKFEIINKDVSASILLEKYQNRLNRSGRKNILQNYYRLDEINSYLDDLATQYSDRVKVQEVGKSYEGRTIKSITITDGNSNYADKKVVFVDAGIHAREWIAPAAALYIIHELVENFNENQHLLKDYDWIVVPVINVDGYEFSHTDSRFWRKTRQPMSSRCFGTDGNRNFDFHWGEVGASSNPCSDTFRGDKAFSEPETHIIRDILHSISGRGKFYLTLHSYGNYLLYPWGWTSSLPDTWKDLHEVGEAGANAIRQKTGNRYTVGSSTNVLYAAAGGSDDYAFAVAKIPIAITMELPSGGLGGFNPPPSAINAMVQETWVGIKAMGEKVIEKY